GGAAGTEDGRGLGHGRVRRVEGGMRTGTLGPAHDSHATKGRCESGRPIVRICDLAANARHVPREPVPNARAAPRSTWVPRCVHAGLPVASGHAVTDSCICNCIWTFRSL